LPNNITIKKADIYRILYTSLDMSQTERVSSRIQVIINRTFQVRWCACEFSLKQKAMSWNSSTSSKPFHSLTAGDFLPGCALEYFRPQETSFGEHKQKMAIVTFLTCFIAQNTPIEQYFSVCVRLSVLFSRTNWIDKFSHQLQVWELLN